MMIILIDVIMFMSTRWPLNSCIQLNWVYTPRKCNKNLVIGENIMVWILKSLTLSYPDAQDLLLFIPMVVNMHSMNLVSRFPPFNINEAVIFLLRENVE